MPFFPQFSNVFVPPYVSISTLRLHLDAGAGVTIGGEDDITWLDQSTVGNDFAGLYATLESNYINGYPAVYFNGTNAYAQSPSTLLDSFSQISIVAVWKVTHGSNLGVFGTANYSDIEITADPNARIRNANYDSQFFSGVDWFDDGVWSISTLVAENGDGQIFKNGTEITTGVTPGNIQLPTRTGIAYRLGQYAWSGYSLFSEMYLAEFYIYSKRLTTGEREDLEGALNTKYEIY